MKWTYHRIKDAGCSKWISGNNWVTKWDNDPILHIGINGQHQTMSGTPDEAKALIQAAQQNAASDCPQPSVSAPVEVGNVGSA